MKQRLILLYLITILFMVVPVPSQTAHAATFNVTNVAELIDALTVSLANDIIEMAPGTYTLTAVHNTNEGPNGLPVVNRNLTINGNGAIIQRSSDIGTPNFRIFRFTNGNQTINNLTISNGNPGAAQVGGNIHKTNSGSVTLNGSSVLNGTANSGGGIYTWTNLTVNDSVISYNNVSGDGGGIYSIASILNINRSVISHNTANHSGGVYRATSIIDSIIANNSAVTTAGGVSAVLTTNTLIVRNSLFSGNSAADAGAIEAGGISLINSTISGNTASAGVGGLALRGTSGLTPSRVIYNSTLAFNTGTTANAILRGVDSPIITLQNTIVHGTSGANCSGVMTSAGYNISTDNTCGLTGTGDMPNTNPQLGALANNGGMTSHALNPGSPAIDAGFGAFYLFQSPTLSFPNDQRGAGFLRISNGRVDIGAFEVQATCPAFPMTANTTHALNVAIGCYNAVTTPGTYQINVTGNITHAEQVIPINNPTAGVSLLIEGNGFTLNGNNAHRSGFLIANNTVVTVQNLTLADGLAQANISFGGGNGGAIYALNHAQLTLTNVNVNNNVSPGSGGGVVFWQFGILNITDSAFNNNSVTGNNVAGGAISSGISTAVIHNTTFTGNSAPGSGAYGGALQISGGTITASTFTNNTASAGAGAIRYTGWSALDISNTAFTGNSSASGGAMLYMAGGTVTITDSTFNGNHATLGGGGAISAGNESITHIENVQFINNPSTSGGGTIVFAGGSSGRLFVRDSVFNGGGLSHGQYGGAIYLFAGTEVVLENLTIYGHNASVNGGAIYNDSQGVVMNNITAYNNNATERGGAFYLIRGATINNATVYGNTAGIGGGGFFISSIPAVVTINNSTIGGTGTGQPNTAPNGGGIFVNFAAQLTLKNSTLTGNTASTAGGGLYAAQASGSNAIALVSNSILAQNTAPSGPNCTIGTGGTITSQGYNLVGNNTNCVSIFATGNPNANNDRVGTGASPIDPLLGALADNGGFNLTRLPLSGSPAIDNGNPATPGSSGTACVTNDQRGISRPRGVRCDIGAVEVAQVVTVAFNTATSAAPEATGIGNVLRVTTDNAGTTQTDVTVQISVTGGTATADDYNLTGTITILAGTAHNALVSVASGFSIVDDNIVENDETVILTLANPSEAVLGAQTTHTHTIQNDDTASAIWSTSTSTVSEGAGTHTVNAQLVVTGTTAGAGSLAIPYTAPVSAANGTAVGDDYALNTASVTFEAGSSADDTQAVTVSITDDRIVEGDETFTLTINGNDHTVTITDNDSASVVWQNASSNANENTSPYTVNTVLVISGTGTGTASLALPYVANITPMDGTALAGVDYNLLTSGVTFSAGSVPGDQQPVNVEIIDNFAADGNKTFTLTVDGNDHAVTILDDESSGVTLAPLTLNVTEGGATDSYEIVLNSQPTADVTVTVSFDAAQVDVSPVSVTFTPAAWDTPQTVTVTAVDDSLIEGAHNTQLTHASASDDADYVIPVAGTVTVNITDNDALLELLTNGGFEIAGAANRDALDWNAKFLIQSDRRVCNKYDKAPPKILADTGDCAYRFKSKTPIPGNRTLRQKPGDALLAQINTGDTLTFNGRASGKNLAGLARIVLKVNYPSGDKDKFTLDIPTGTYPYQTLTSALVMTETPNKIVLIIQPRQSTGVFWVDNFSLTVGNIGVLPDVAPLTLPDDLIPLPLPEVSQADG